MDGYFLLQAAWKMESILPQKWPQLAIRGWKDDSLLRP